MKSVDTTAKAVFRPSSRRRIEGIEVGYSFPATTWDCGEIVNVQVITENPKDDRHVPPGWSNAAATTPFDGCERDNSIESFRDRMILIY